MSPDHRRLTPAALTLLLVISGCATPATPAPSNSGPPPAASPPPAVSSEPAVEQASPEAAPIVMPEINPVPLGKGRFGVRRDELQKMVDQGANQFIALVDVRPTFRHGRFFGWRVIEYRGPGHLEPGDVVFRINHRQIERPQQFMAVWQALPGRKAVVVEVLRRGRPKVINVPIVDPAAKK